MIWSAPVESEHKAVQKFIRHQRRKDLITCIIFAVAGFIFLAAGIYAIYDRFKYAFGLFIPAVILLLIAGGCALTNAEESKHVKKREYEVSRCRVVSRNITRTKYSTDRRVTVTVLSTGKQSTYTVTAETYRKASEGSPALLVDYSREHEGKRDIHIDMVIPDPED